MKYIISVVLFVVSVTVTAAPWWAPSPLAVAITVGKWLSKDQTEVFYLRVQATGKDEQDARDQAFRLAVEQAVGSLVTHQTKVINGEMITHEIVNYSSGYVHDFQIVKRQYSEDKTQIEIDVWIKRSAIADRLLGSSTDSASINGEKLNAQYQTLMRERQSGDRMLAMILDDYPSKSFEVKISRIDQKINSKRNLEIELAVSLSWNQNYIIALIESINATAVTNQAGECLRSSSFCNYEYLVGINYRSPEDRWYVSKYAFAYDDNIKSNLMQMHFSRKNPVILVKMIDGQGKILYGNCYGHHELTQTNYRPAKRFVHSDQWKTIIDGTLSTSPKIIFETPSRLIADSMQIQAEIIDQSKCPR